MVQILFSTQSMYSGCCDIHVSTYIGKFQYEDVAFCAYAGRVVGSGDVFGVYDLCNCCPDVVWEEKGISDGDYIVGDGRGGFGMGACAEGVY